MRVSIFALVGAFALLLFIDFYASPSTTAPHGLSTAATTSGVYTYPGAAPPIVTLPNILATAASSSTTTAKVATTKKPLPVAQQPTPAPPAAAPAPRPQYPVGDISSASDNIRNALVNILCYAPAGSSINSISGSGVIVSPKGYIITNAHIAQYFLLSDLGVHCIVRTGSPARDAYNAALAFISPAWVRDNATVITQSQPTGTGEHDLAILAISGSATGAPLPTSFPAVALEWNESLIGEPVVIGSYAAQFIDSATIVSALSPTIVYGSIKAIFTFATDTVDVFWLGGSAAAQEGSSGGGVVDASGALTGLIVTSTTMGDTSARNLSAITATYIRRDYTTEASFAIDDLFNETPATAVANFAPQIPNLEALITAHL